MRFGLNDFLWLRAHMGRDRELCEAVYEAIERSDDLPAPRNLSRMGLGSVTVVSDEWANAVLKRYGYVYPGNKAFFEIKWVDE